MMFQLSSEVRIVKHFFSYTPYIFLQNRSHATRHYIYLLQIVSTCHIRHGHFITTQPHLTYDIHKYAQEKNFFEPFCFIPTNCSFWPSPSTVTYLTSLIKPLAFGTTQILVWIIRLRHLWPCNVCCGHGVAPIPNTDTHRQLFCLWKWEPQKRSKTGRYAKTC